MRDIFIGITFILVVVIAPVAALGWIVYRAVKGSSENNKSITGK